MNQTLEGHTGAVMCATWNPQFRKLTTSDDSGLIIVWTVHKDAWYEEMINNRNKSVVRDMKWTSDGRKICIIYEDGAVIVGSVDGNRLWGKELSLPLRFVEWSPDNKLILFVTLDAEIWVYDADGTKLRAIEIPAQDPATAGEVPIVGVNWFSPVGGTSGKAKKNVAELPPTLCIAFENGIMQLSRGDEDLNPVIVDTEMTATFCKWDSSGAVLAVTGAQKSSRGTGENKTVNVIKFYDAYGRFLRSIRIPGDSLTSMTWEGSGLRLAVAVDSHIFFANIRPAYTWAYLLNTVVYTYHRSSDRRESAVVFWDQTTGETHTKFVQNLKQLATAGDYCVIVVADKDMAGRGGNSSSASSGPGGHGLSPGGGEVYRIQLRNAIGAIIDTRVVPFLPKRVAMSACHLVATNDRTVYTWQFQSQAGKGSSTSSEGQGSGSPSETSGSRSGGKERMFDIEHASVSSAQPPETFRMIQDMVTDPIACIAASSKFLVVARKGGSIMRYTLPHLSPENTYTLQKCEPFRIDLNCTSSKLALVDINGVFTVLDLEVRKP